MFGILLKEWPGTVSILPPKEGTVEKWITFSEEHKIRNWILIDKINLLEQSKKRNELTSNSLYIRLNSKV